jgi:beta-galactosidase/beta-glucuronidase
MLPVAIGVIEKFSNSWRNNRVINGYFSGLNTLFAPTGKKVISTDTPVRTSLWRAGMVSALALIMGACSSQSELATDTAATKTMMLSGTGSDDAVEWDFYCDKGRNCGEWSKIAVPSNWELEGFGGYDYGHIREKHNEQGTYRRDFDVPASWQNRTVKVVFDGVMTDTTVFVNDQQVGPTHQGGFYRFSYDITPYLNFGESNQIKVVVDKISADKSIEAAERQADYWVFGGIFRQVFLQALPASHIDWVSLDAKASGQFDAEVYFEGLTGAETGVEAQILDMDGKPVGKPFSAPLQESKAVVSTAIANPELWSAEYPNLYQVRFTLKAGTDTLHTLNKTFGFRTFELRPHEGMYLNGEKIILKGVNLQR